MNPFRSSRLMSPLWNLLFGILALAALHVNIRCKVPLAILIHSVFCVSFCIWSYTLSYLAKLTSYGKAKRIVSVLLVMSVWTGLSYGLTMRFAAATFVYQDARWNNGQSIFRVMKEIAGPTTQRWPEKPPPPG